jgi:phosphoribosylformimino-5-aminoimidazole carboxamide ribotide isomerase
VSFERPEASLGLGRGQQPSGGGPRSGGGPSVGALEVFFAIDLLGGLAVRLERGAFDRVLHLGDPVALAERYAAQGARWLHVVDLDAARLGRAVDRRLVGAIARATGCAVQAGGGVRSAADVEELLELGAARVVVGTAAVRAPRLLATLAEAYPGRVVLALDYGGPARAVKVAGWTASSTLTADALLARIGELPLGAVVATATDHDGMLDGPDLEGLRELVAASPHPLVASGGVRDAADIRRIAGLGPPRLAGVIVGKAVALGRLGVAEALEAAHSGRAG